MPSDNETFERWFEQWQLQSAQRKQKKQAQVEKASTAASSPSHSGLRPVTETLHVTMNKLLSRRGWGGAPDDFGNTYQGRNFFEAEPSPLGVDMIALHAYLPQTAINRQNLKAFFPKFGASKEPYFLGAKRKGKFWFCLSHYPSPNRTGYDLKIRFNPATLINSHNLRVDDPRFLEESLRHLQHIVDAAGFDFQVESLLILELHLARNITLYAGHANTRVEIQDEEDEVQDLLNFLSWSIPGYTKRVKNYDDAHKTYPAKGRRILKEGFKRGNNSWEWTIYDKTLELKQNKPTVLAREPFASVGRILRVEWKLKGKHQIHKKLWITTPSQLLDFLLRTNKIEQLFNGYLEQAYFPSYKPYGQRLPTVPAPLISELQPWATSAKERSILQYLNTGQTVLRDDVDAFIQIVNRVGPKLMRSILRKLYGFDGAPSSKPQYNHYYRCQEMLMCLRQHSTWRGDVSWKEREEEAFYLVLPRGTTSFHEEPCSDQLRKADDETAQANWPSSASSIASTLIGPTRS